MTEFVYVFDEERASFPSAVFSTKEKAYAWIKELGARGTLTEYPVDVPAYDFAVENGYFKPKKPHHFENAFKTRFTNATGWHEHFNMDDD